MSRCVLHPKINEKHRFWTVVFTHLVHIIAQFQYNLLQPFRMGTLKTHEKCIKTSNNIIPTLMERDIKLRATTCSFLRSSSISRFCLFSRAASVRICHIGNHVNHANKLKLNNYIYFTRYRKDHCLDQHQNIYMDTFQQSVLTSFTFGETQQSSGYRQLRTQVHSIVCWMQDNSKFYLEALTHTSFTWAQLLTHLALLANLRVPLVSSMCICRLNGNFVQNMQKQIRYQLVQEGIVLRMQQL